MLKNKYMYGKRVLSVDPVSKKETLGPVERHVIDTGAEELYCGDYKALFKEVEHD